MKLNVFRLTSFNSIPNYIQIDSEICEKTGAEVFVFLNPCSSSEFDMIVALTRSSLSRVPHTWMSGTKFSADPRAWFWGTHNLAKSAALLGRTVSRIAGNVLVFGPLLHRGIERRSLRQSFRDGNSVCNGLFWGERWWSVGVVATDGMLPGLGCILQSCRGRWLPFRYGWEVWLL